MRNNVIRSTFWLGLITWAIILGSFALMAGDLPTEYQIRKAKDEVRAADPRCAVCGVRKSLESKRRNDVHHRHKVSDYPELAATKTNLVVLCIVHHRVVGHPKGTKSYNPNLQSDIDRLKVIYDQIRSNALMQVKGSTNNPSLTTPKTR